MHKILTPAAARRVTPRKNAATFSEKRLFTRRFLWYDELYDKNGGVRPMMVTVRSLGLTGISGYEVSVECFLSGGLPGFDVVGLPDTAVKESRERVRAAVKNCGAKFPVSRITVNLAPARLRKEGTVYDLPILLGILAAAEELKPLPADAAFLGELSLSGALRPVTGVLPMALTAARLGIKTLFVPAANAAEATLADGVTVYGVETVGQLIAHLTGQQAMQPAPRWMPVHQPRPMPDFADVMGQENVKRGLRSPPPAATTCCWWGRPARANPCWPGASPPSCRT